MSKDELTQAGIHNKPVKQAHVYVCELFDDHHRG